MAGANQKIQVFFFRRRYNSCFVLIIICAQLFDDCVVCV
jgi:hypothetical protein